MTWLDALAYLILIPVVLALFIGWAYVAWEASKDAWNKRSRDSWMREIDRRKL